jgi:hypothetical protein
MVLPYAVRQKLLHIDRFCRNTQNLVKTNKSKGHVAFTHTRMHEANGYRSRKCVDPTIQIKKIIILSCDSHITHLADSGVVFIFTAVGGAVGRCYTTSICRTKCEPNPPHPDTPLHSHTCSSRDDDVMVTNWNFSWTWFWTHTVIIPLLNNQMLAAHYCAPDSWLRYLRCTELWCLLLLSR